MFLSLLYSIILVLHKSLRGSTGYKVYSTALAFAKVLVVGLLCLII